MHGIRDDQSTGERGFHAERAVLERYSMASAQTDGCLCCPVDYDSRWLEVLPREIIERDYGCGDPSRHVESGETVLDLGSGTGKICYIASQIVGPRGRVIGVDMNDQMLALARKYRLEIGDRIGWHNVEFRKGRIQDLALDLERFEKYLKEHPVTSADAYLEAMREADVQRRASPMIPDNSVDVVLSNCVLNLVQPSDRCQLFQEIGRVLKRGGRAVISDIVCDEPVPEHLQRDPDLWSGCLSGAHQEHEFLKAFERAGFYGIEILDWQPQPWAVVEGIEFRSVTIRAFHGKEGPCLDHKEAVVYRGPWRAVIDDDGHTLHRGQRMAVCRKTYEIYTSGAYGDQVIPVPPREAVPEGQAAPFDCRGNQTRPPRETKGAGCEATILPESPCCSGPGERC